MPQRLGKYSLLKLLATGGMAEIWLARQKGVEGFEKLVVVKRILPHLSSNAQFVSMFLDEARLAAQLSHPHIVQIYELGRVEELYFIAMEFIHGENLRVVSRAATKAGSGLGPELCAKVISQSCEALYYAHTKTDITGRPLGIVHRDISPQNIILSFEGQTKVVDFGIAKAATKCEETRTGVLKGKYAYMSPEQCRGDKLDGRSDIFALGIVLWELATGTRLFKQASELMILKAICDEPTIPPTHVRKDIPPQLEAIILKALEKEPADRFQDCHEMHLALESYLRTNQCQVGAMALAREMQSLFAEKLAGWQKVIESLQEDDDDDLESQLFSDLSGLIEGRTPSSQITRSPASAASGSKPLIAVAEEGSPAATPRTPAPSPPPEAASSPPRIDSKPRRGGRTGLATGILVALLLGVSGTWAFQTFVAGGDLIDGIGEELLSRETATLTIESTPSGADVFIGDSRRGATPLTLSDIPVNEAQSVRVKTPGYEPWRTEVTLERAGSRRRLSAHLEEDGSAPPAVLEIRTEPSGARLFVANEPVEGRTPLTLEIGADRAGRKLRIERDGFETETRKLDVVPGSRGRWELALRREASTEPEPRPTTRPGTRPGTRPPRPSTSPATSKVEAPAKGHLSINARPWCNVTVNGRALGQTPVLNAEVEAGRVQVLCANPELGASRTVTVDVPAGGQARETITFPMGRLDVRVRPWAEVSVDGRSLGTTPFQPRPLPEGSYTVVLENPSFGFRKEYQVTIRPDETHTIRENLLE